MELLLLTAGLGSLWPRAGRFAPAECLQSRMPALQPRPLAAEAPVDQTLDFADCNPSSLGCLVLLMFDLSGPYKKRAEKPIHG